MNQATTLAACFFATVLASLTTIAVGFHTDFLMKKPPETVFERVMRTGTIRCGYVNQEPYLMKDPNDGQFSGIMYEIMQELGRQLNLKIEWAEEVTIPMIGEEQRTNRIDMFCSAAIATTGEGRVSDFGIPLWYTPIDAYVRKDDHRFDNDLRRIDHPEFSISSIAGTIPNSIATVDFPLARHFELPENADYSLNLQNVVNGKADVTFVPAYQANSYLFHNSDTLRNVSVAKPLRVYPNSVSIKKNEFAFYQMINNGLSDLLNSGYVDRAIDRYEQFPNSLFRVAKPYSDPRSH